MKTLIAFSLLFGLLLSLSACATGKVIDGDEIENALLDKKTDFKNCYLKIAPTEPSGSFRVHFVILPEGNVSSATIEDNSLKAPVVENCVLDTLKQIQFPKSAKNGRIEVMYPFRFHAHDSVEPEVEAVPTIQLGPSEQ
jgi:TonB family protein